MNFELKTGFDVKIRIHPSNGRITLDVLDPPGAVISGGWLTKEESLKVAAALIQAALEV